MWQSNVGWRWIISSSLVCVYAIGVLVFMIVVPDIEGVHELSFPNSVHRVKEAHVVFERYVDSHTNTIYFGFSLLYIFLQCFSIPGTAFLNCCAGALFGFYAGFWLCIINGTIGASSAYGLSLLFGKSIVTRYFPQRLAFFSAEISKHRNSLFNYLLFLRITPLLPNWFINLACPVLDVPFIPFCLATFIGIMPQTFLTVEVGLTLSELDPSQGISVVSLKTIILLMSLGILSLLPTIPSIRRRLFFTI